VNMVNCEIKPVKSADIAHILMKRNTKPEGGEFDRKDFTNGVRYTLFVGNQDAPSKVTEMVTKMVTQLDPHDGQMHFMPFRDTTKKGIAYKGSSVTVRPTSAKDLDKVIRDMANKVNEYKKAVLCPDCHSNRQNTQARHGGRCEKCFKPTYNNTPFGGAYAGYVREKDAKKRVLIYIGSEANEQGLKCDDDTTLRWTTLNEALNQFKENVEVVIFMSNNKFKKVTTIEEVGAPVKTQAVKKVTTIEEVGAPVKTDDCLSSYWDKSGELTRAKPSTLERHESARTPDTIGMPAGLWGDAVEAEKKAGGLALQREDTLDQAWDTTQLKRLGTIESNGSFSSRDTIAMPGWDDADGTGITRHDTDTKAPGAASQDSLNGTNLSEDFRRRRLASQQGKALAQKLLMTRPRTHILVVEALLEEIRRLN